jgi:PRC-barrel domain
MAETNQTGNFHEVPGAASRSAGAGASSRAPYPPRHVEARGSERWDDYDERRRRRTTDLFFEDSMVLLGILLGGAAGYMAASSVRGANWSSRSRQASGRSSSTRSFGQQSRTRPSSSVEKDETTDLIASNKVEGTVVYNRQGEKLGEVYNFMVGKRSGQVAYAIMSFGGFLGIGQKYHPLPWNALTYDTGKKGYMVDADRERLMAAPSYGGGEEPFSQPEYGRQVRDYWSSDLT